MHLPKGFSSDLDLAVVAVLAAGDCIMEKYRGNVTVYSKNSDSMPVTEADKESNKIILETLAPLGYPIFSEEDLSPMADFTTGKAWIVDPLDGTKDFINGTDEFTILIGLISDGHACGGVVYQPVTKALYVSELGHGAYKATDDGWKLLRVNDVDNVASARLVMSRHHLVESEKDFISSLEINTFTQKGSSGLKMVKIADSHYDAYFTFTNNIKQWDLCAADCILAEAGGIITGLDGSPIRYGNCKANVSNGVLVSNGRKIHDQLLVAYKKYINLK